MAEEIRGKTNRAQKERHPVRRRRRLTLNIGTFLFGALFVYIMVSLIFYLTATHVVSYQVTSGPLAKNQTYTALILRTEEVVTSETAGYVTYYAQENAKIRKNAPVYGTGPTRLEISGDELDEASLKEIASDMENFAGSFDPTDFSRVYDFKYKTGSRILSSYMAQSEELQNVTEAGKSLTYKDQTISTAGNAGVVVYSLDGYEDFDLNTIDEDSLNRKSYTRTELMTDETISVGQPVYKLVSSEKWSVVIPLTSRQIVDLNGRTSIRVKFLEDNTSMVGTLSILTGTDGAYYGKIDFTNGMIRYINERFTSIELVTNTQTGLKIPVSSVVRKNFYLIPEEFAVEGGDTGSVGFLRQTEDEKGNETVEFVSPTLYEHKDGYYYIDNDALEEGDVLVKSGSEKDKMTIGETGQLDGVYSLNKGYALFRKVNIIDKNEDYCIVEKGTSYGIAQFDYIVLDSSQVKEEEITVRG